MAKIKFFRIRNFKGIEDITIRLSNGSSRAPVIMLLGLNESGKTTILEGISNFTSRNSDLEAIFSASGQKRNVSDFIPLIKLSNFNESTSISASVDLDQEDIAAVEDFCKQHNEVLDTKSFSKNFSITQSFRFSNSVLESTENQWGVVFNVLRGRRKTKFQVRPLSLEEGGFDLWREVVQLLRERLPKISYFPTFIVDMPDRIYLKKVDGESISSPYLRSIIQQVFDAEGTGISLNSHVIDRVEDFKRSNGGRFDGQKFSSSAQRRQINAVFQKFSSMVSYEILNNWKKIFNRPLNASSINIRWDVDPQQGDAPYLGMDISDGNESYKISERSLGFRWFFSFLLFTKFKQRSGIETIFLFDEPASNLHARAQQELLLAFSQVAEKNQIIFSTHSHHMIDPAWLSSAYIVENKAIDFDADDDDASKFGRHTDVCATPYRAFASQYPSRSSYFQPVLEKLEYVPPGVVGDEPFLILEGISDYYVFKSVAKTLNLKLSVTPGSGAGASGPLISLLMGRGLKFRILLDGDAAGAAAADRYKKIYNLGDNEVITLSDIDMRWNDKGLEKLLDKDTLDAMLKKSGFESIGKKNIRLIISSLHAQNNLCDTLSEKTKSDIEKILHAVIS